MSSESIITVENLSKSYTLKHQQDAHYSTLRDTLVNGVKGFGKKILGRSNPDFQEKEEFWALKDVNFEIKQGDRVGIIGRNGAGKSTLLKILSRITEPTTGKIHLKGRVASLLEVGTGFHPELTGRENIFLNGAILGMSKWEIKKNFDEIVAFAEIEKFLDTPVKRYSSGMYVRLAFAVAAHLEPEILVVDEVLAVGDAQFQKKCLGKMEDVGKEGRTVLFVSHNMGMIRQLCNQSLILDGGTIEGNGEVECMVRKYLKKNLQENSKSIQDRIKELPHDPVVEFSNFCVMQNNEKTLELQNGKELTVMLEINVKEKQRDLRVYIDVLDSEGNLLFRSFNDEKSENNELLALGEHSYTIGFPARLFAPKSYQFIANATIYNVRNCLGDGLSIEVNFCQSYRHNSLYPNEPIRSQLLTDLTWGEMK